jgi:hypothetical protein
MSARISDLPIPEVVAAKAAERSEVVNETIAAGAVELVNLHRDERDVRLLLQMTASQILILMILFMSLAGNVWQYWRRPDRIVVDRTATGDRVVIVNDNPINAAVSWGPDKPGDEDKRRLANEWATARYAIDPLTREQTIEKLLRMMEPNAAAKFVAILKQHGELERERGERRQASWKPQLTVIDSGNPYRVNVVGVQELTRVLGNAPQRETKQIMFSLKVMPDRDEGRAAHNLHTGFLVLDILDVREVSNGGNNGDSILPQSPPAQ